MVTRQDCEGEKDTIEMTALADFCGDCDDYYITYTDDDGELKGCKTTLHVENESLITISRDGGYDAHMIIEKNARHISHHATPYGSFSMGISALDVFSAMTKDGGKLNFRYTTDIDLHPVGEIEIDITIKQRNMQ